MTCPDYERCKERLGVDPMIASYEGGCWPTHRRIHSICETCPQFDYEEAQKERIGKRPEEHPIPTPILRKEFNQLKGEVAHIHTEVHSLKGLKSRIDKKRQPKQTNVLKVRNENE
jgi:hypothetical protein